MPMNLLLVVFTLLLNSCGHEPLYQSQSYVFGTLVDISIYGESEPHARELANHVQQEFQRLHDSLHAWKEGSNLTRLNTAFAKGQTPLAVSPELAQIIQDATALSTRSNQLFNPAIGNLIKLWGFQRDEYSPVPIDPDAINALVKQAPRMSDIVVEHGTAYSQNPAVRLDFGGYAKGYALDKAAAYLRQQGVKNALINIGGNIIALGQHGDHPWRVGIQHPRKPGPIAMLDLPDGWAIGTSGDYQRYFEIDGKRYCHIIDPRDGYPAGNTQAVTILVPPAANAGTLSDAASKPIFISGLEDKGQAAQVMGISNYMVIDAQGRVFVSAAMRKRLQWSEKVMPKENNVQLENLP